MSTYQARVNRLNGTRYDDVYRKARKIFDVIKKRTKRQPYIRSAYFKKEKIFFNYFWLHLQQKSRKNRTKRLLYFPCAIDVIEHSRNAPTIKINPNRPNETLYRFTGLTKNKETFYIQIKEVKRTKSKYLMSIFPPKQKTSRQ